VRTTPPKSDLPQGTLDARFYRLATSWNASRPITSPSAWTNGWHGGGHRLFLIGTGLMLGLAGAAALTRYLEGMLYGLTTLDPVTFAGALALLAAAATVASWVPARRATHVDPLVALRSD
jgi:hypothetical protein